MKKKIPVQIIELEEGNYHVIVSGNFSDGNMGYWAIDTGASKTVFDKNLENYYEVSNDETEEIHSAGIGDEPLKTTIGNLKSFSLGKYKVENLKVALIDLSHINELYHRATSMEICGLIGGDFLMNHKAIIDYKRKIITLHF